MVATILLLPAGIAERLTPPQLEAVLAHELCHVRRRDNLLALIHMLVEALFWFHPLVWWIGTRLVEERERACDEAVLSLGSEPRVYAEGILNVCKLYVESPLVCVSGVTGSDIKKRIEAIMINRTVLRLSFVKKLALGVAGIAALAAPIAIGVMNAPALDAQSADTPKFEVVSIRPGCGAGDNKGGGGAAPSPGRLNVCGTVMTFILQAYGRFATGHFNPNLAAVPVEGGPAWIKSDSYQINAKAEGNAGEEMMRGPMLQALLEDRFKLKIHRETRDLPMYALTAGKSGPKLTQFKEGGCVPPDLTKVPPPPPTPGQKLCDYRVGRGKGLNLTVDAQGRTLAELSRLLGVALDRPVVDKTGIAGLFDIHLEFAIDQTTPNFLPGGPLDSPGGGPPAEPADPAGGPSIFTAIQEQLGLKLDPVKVPGEFLVIDSVEKPSAN
jgi:bla regulator protein BlaR1